MKNKLSDLNNHLFAALERLNDEDVKGEALTEEIQRSKAIAGVAKEVVANASLVLEGAKFAKEHGSAPEVLGIEDKS
jgi:hypothetical protein